MNNHAGDGHLANRLLAALSPEDFALLAPHLVTGALVQSEPIFGAGLAATHVWFPHEGVISFVAVDTDGEAIEIATIGPEGMTGVAVALGSETMRTEAMVQVAGRASSIETWAFRQALETSPTLKQMMLRYVLAVITQISQNAACGQLHAINTRCARWLLTTHDRVSGDSFHLTQEYLAMMLGVTRPSVSGAAGALQHAGLIRYSRGIITVVNRPGLESAACECYRIIEDEFGRLRGHG
ncbi:MAG TPA: Crp/Fnr family transcriptional regulator [Caulobacteraceae bacterium]